MIDELNAIPGNERAIDSLNRVIRSGNSIGFLGAGVSSGLYPLWSELIYKLADEAVARGLASQDQKQFWLEQARDAPDFAADAIERAMGSQIFSSYLQDLFSAKQTANGCRFTDLQKALMQLEFKGFVTTNYDPGIIEARHAIRPDASATGYCTWQDRDALRGWVSGDVFRTHQCPILFAHGIYERSETLVLGIEKYRKVYGTGLFRRTFDKLWHQENLVIVGFSFADQWVRFAQEDLLGDLGFEQGLNTRHIAIVGIPESEQYTADRRRKFLELFQAEVVFYPVRNDGRDHSALLTLLENLNQWEQPSRHVEKKNLIPRRQRWVHETTNDDRYAGRDFCLERLEYWASDNDVKLIAITGLGGQGKTSLVGHWLKACDGATKRGCSSLFYWSFYANRSVSDFLDSFIKFTGFLHGRPRKKNESGRKHRLSDNGLPKIAKLAFESEEAILVLDGLEVLQERPGTSAFGAFLEDDLREFLDGLARTKHNGLTILTSRFPFSDLRSMIGSSVRILRLGRLRPDEGALLLHQCDVGGSSSDRKAISKGLEGHPLALRIFAATLSTQTHGDPTRLWNIVFNQSELRTDDRLEGKLTRLLSFYERHLPEAQLQILRIVSLFRFPVEEAIILRLACSQFEATWKEPVATEEMELAVLDLVDNGLIVHENDGTQDQLSCHPVLRDHFRETFSRVEGSKYASEAAAILVDRPSTRKAENLGDIVPFLNAIELLVDAKRIDLADSIYSDRLNSGEVFLALPSVHEGLRCVLHFIGNGQKIEDSLAVLPRDRVVMFLNSAGLFSAHAGEAENAEVFFELANRLSHNYANSCVALRGYGAIQLIAGKTTEAEHTLFRALEYAQRIRDNQFFRASVYAELGNLFVLRGNGERANTNFRYARDLSKSEQGSALKSLWRTYWAYALYRFGYLSRAQKVIDSIEHREDVSSWLCDLARCNRIRGLIFSHRGDLTAAKSEFDEAEAVFRKGHMLPELAGVLIDKSICLRTSDRFEESISHAEEALRIAGPRELRLLKADALIARGTAHYSRAMKNETNPSEKEMDLFSAFDDGEAGLQISKLSRYPWAELDALNLLEATSSALNVPQDTAHIQRQKKVKAQLSIFFRKKIHVEE